VTTMRRRWSALRHSSGAASSATQEAREQARRGHRVAEGHGDVLPRERVDAVPPAARQRGRLPVARVVDVAEDEVQRLLRDVQAQRAAQPPRLRGLPAHGSDGWPFRLRLRGGSPGIWSGERWRHGDLFAPTWLF
jgi:hypothetical protein